MDFSPCYGDSVGTIFSLGKLAVENGAKPFGVAQFQVMFAGVVLLFITVIRRKSIQDMKDKLGFIFCVALLGVFCFILQHRTFRRGCCPSQLPSSLS